MRRRPRPGIRKEQREAVEEFNKRLTERDETLEKWKAAYEQAATVARSKDAERAKFEGEANTYKASTKGCRKEHATRENRSRACASQTPTSISATSWSRANR